MRDDKLAHVLDENRFRGSFDTALDMFRAGEEAVTGEEVAGVYGLLVHYTNSDRLPSIIESESIGPGCWLTPTIYPACMVPYNLGLGSPRDICLLIDVSSILELWGPGTCRPSTRHAPIWPGGGIEFYTPKPVEFSLVRSIIEIEPCGDTHL